MVPTSEVSPAGDIIVPNLNPQKFVQKVEAPMPPSEISTGTVPPPLLTVDDLAAVLKVSKRTIWRMRSCCQLPKPVKVGGGVRWRQADIDTWIGQGCPLLPARKQD